MITPPFSLKQALQHSTDKQFPQLLLCYPVLPAVCCSARASEWEAVELQGCTFWSGLFPSIPHSSHTPKAGGRGYGCMWLWLFVFKLLEKQHLPSQIQSRHWEGANDGKNRAQRVRGCLLTLTWHELESNSVVCSQGALRLKSLRTTSLHTHGERQRDSKRAAVAA